MAGKEGQVTIKVTTTVDDSEVKDVDALIENLKNKGVAVDVAVEDAEILNADEEIEGLNKTAQVTVDVDDSAVQGAMQNINDGVNQAKQGFSELSGAFDAVQQAGMQSEQNKAFLEMNLGADKAKQTYQDISDIVASMPGDDNTMRSVLSTAQALGTNLKPDEMRAATTTMADYMSGSATMGKQAIESQQDIMKYLLDGNTAELERGSIVSSQVDKLKEATTFQERQAAMQEVLNDLGYGGISQQDTMLNKQAEWEGMLYNSSDTLSSMWLGAEKGAMDFFLKLNDVSGGLAGIGLVAATQLGPALLGIGQGAFTALPGIMQFSEKVGGLSGLTSMVGTKLSGLPGILGTVGSALTGLGAGPIVLIIGALIALAVAVFEVGKAFGWWSDLGTMFEAISAGAQRMWSAFMNNEGVIMIIDQIKGAFNNLLTFIGEIGSIIGQALGFDQMGGEFDIVRAAIDALGQVGSFVLPLISGYIDYMKAVFAALAPIVTWVLQNVIIPHFQRVYSTALAVWPVVSSIISGAVSIITGIINGAKGVFNGLMSIWHQCSSTVQSMASIISGALSAAGTAWNNFKTTVMNAVQPILDAAGQVGDAISGIGAAIGFGGIETPVVNNPGYSAGSTMVSQGNTIIFNMYGDIKDEKTLDDTIDAINNRIQFEALGNGTTTTDNGGAI